MYSPTNKPQSQMTADPSKYPQKYFKEKECKYCKTIFKPKAPSHKYCCQQCADKAWSNNYLKNNYKITQQEYEKLEEKQNHTCAICKTSGFKMREHHFKKLVVDHCHTTGKVRGLLCHNCNRALGLLKDSKSALQNAINYLEGN